MSANTTISRASRVAGDGPRRRLVALSLALVTALVPSLAWTGPAHAHKPAPSEFYGVTPTTALDENDFRRLARANIGNIRVIFFWPSIGRDPWTDWRQWLNVDASVIRASEAGVALLPTLMGSAKHISDDPYRPPLSSPADRLEWAQFVRSAVQRYGPGGEFWDFLRECRRGEPGYCRLDIPYRPIRTWQLWNEPNLGILWHPNPSPQEYGELLKLTADAIHSVDPDGKLITGGLMRGGRGTKNAISQNSFLTSLYRIPGVAERIGGVDLHPYRRKPRAVRRLVENARKIMQAHGAAETPIWISEVGWSTRGPKREELVTTGKGQAKRLTKTMRMLTRLRGKLGIEMASWFTYKDDWDLKYCVWCHGAGLFNRKGKPKPAWKRYVKITGGRS